MPAIPGLASLAGSLPGSVRVPGRTPTGLGVAERAGARGTSEIQIAGCARRCFRAEIEGRGFDSPHLQERSGLSVVGGVHPLMAGTISAPAWLQEGFEYRRREV